VSIFSYIKKKKKKLSLVSKKTLQFHSTKNNYSSFLSNKQGYTNFFNSNNRDIDNFNLFNYSRLYSSFKFKSSNNLNIQNYFFKNKISTLKSNYNFENYFFNIASLRRKERIARTNYITRRSNFLFKLKPGYLVY